MDLTHDEKLLRRYRAVYPTAPVQSCSDDAPEPSESNPDEPIIPETTTTPDKEHRVNKRVAPVHVMSQALLISSVFGAPLKDSMSIAFFVHDKPQLEDILYAELIQRALRRYW